MVQKRVSNLAVYLTNTSGLSEGKQTNKELALATETTPLTE